MSCAELCEAVATEKRAKSRLWSIISGLVFGSAWWFFIDGAAVHKSSTEGFPFTFFLPMVGQFVAFFLVNAIDWDALDPDSGLYANPNAPCINRSILIFGLILQLGCLTGAVWILVGVYADRQDPFAEKLIDNSVVDGILILLANLLVFFSTWMMRWGNIPPEDGGVAF